MVRLTCRKAVCAGVVMFGIASLAYGGNANSALRLLQNAFSMMAELEPFREGPLHDYARGMSVIRHNPSPAVRFMEPLDGGEFRGYLAVEIDNWFVDPSQATNAATQFANGKQENNAGHTHVWIFDQETGARVRFTGANGLLLNPATGLHESADFTLPPGEYKAYVQLQNHDHTAAIPATAPALPGIDAVVFYVPESE